MGLQDVQDLGLGQVEAEGFEGDFELVVVDVAVLVQVEEGELCGVLASLVFCVPLLEIGTYRFIHLFSLLLAERVQHAALLRLSSLSLCALLPLAL